MTALFIAGWAMFGLGGMALVAAVVLPWPTKAVVAWLAVCIVGITISLSVTNAWLNESRQFEPRPPASKGVWV